MYARTYAYAYTLYRSVYLANISNSSNNQYRGRSLIKQYLIIIIAIIIVRMIRIIIRIVVRILIIIIIIIKI